MENHRKNPRKNNARIIQLFKSLGTGKAPFAKLSIRQASTRIIEIMDILGVTEIEASEIGVLLLGAVQSEMHNWNEEL